jgi:hypothetical protein
LVGQAVALAVVNQLVVLFAVVAVEVIDSCIWELLLTAHE